MAAGDIPSGPIESFLRADASLFDAATSGDAPAAGLVGLKDIRGERCVSLADPCQSRAVALARHARGLVVHGPPGTGKSQTITNIIGDHLARGERVLMVCDKRTAIDVVHQRLEHLGLGDLCAVIHDAQGDRRQLYMSVREQLERLAETPEDHSAPARLEQIDVELEQVHGEFLRYLRLLDERPSSEQSSFSELAGIWIRTHGTGIEDAMVSADTFHDTTVHALAPLEKSIREALQRGVEIGYAVQPWRTAAGMPLREYLGLPLASVRSMVESARTTADAVDSHLSTPVTPFGAGTDLLDEATARRDFAEKWERCGEGTLERAPQWLQRDPDAWSRALARVASLGEQRQILKAAPEDPELDLAYRNLKPDWNALQADLRGLEEFEASLKVWYGFVQFGARKAGREIVTRYGLRATAEDAGRLRAYLGVRKAAHLVADVVRKELPLLATDDLEDVASLVSLLGQHEQSSRRREAGPPLRGGLGAPQARSSHGRGRSEDLRHGPSFLDLCLCRGPGSPPGAATGHLLRGLLGERGLLHRRGPVASRAPGGRHHRIARGWSALPQGAGPGRVGCVPHGRARVPGVGHRAHLDASLRPQSRCRAGENREEGQGRIGQGAGSFRAGLMYTRGVQGAAGPVSRERH